MTLVRFVVGAAGGSSLFLLPTDANSSSAVFPAVVSISLILEKKSLRSAMFLFNFGLEMGKYVTMIRLDLEELKVDGVKFQQVSHKIHFIILLCISEGKG